ncbi:MAG: hypothetical protein IJU95_07250, partial [Treponema sp.]|nr:hypothetical protein [Treponema sp.]
ADGREFCCLLSIRDDVDFSRLSQEQRLHSFRIMQEAVSNASHHSGAEEVSVMFRAGTLPDGRKSIVLIVSDDGRGFIPLDLPSRQSDGQGHYGLAGMRSRAEVLGGNFRIRTEPGEGCEVFIEVPLKWGGVKNNLLTARAITYPSRTHRGLSTRFTGIRLSMDDMASGIRLPVRSMVR